MNFKDTLKTDLDVFLCQDEFGEIHDLNGRKVTCIVQSPTAREMVSGTKIRRLRRHFRTRSGYSC